MKNRIAIYAFYDEEGIIDDYVYYFLNALKKLAKRIIFVSNGPIKQEYINIISKITNEILIRDNVGFDAHAYKYAFDYIGFKNLNKYDEVISCNSTFFGPIYELENVFLKMEKNENLDFWGITQHPDYFVDSKDNSEFCINPYGYIPKHIQSYFIVYKNRLLSSNYFYNFWDSLPMINNYKEAIELFETVLTKHFSDLGFKWDTYIKYNEKLIKINYPLLYKPLDVVKEYNCPIIKRKSFFLENELTIQYSTKKQIEKLFQFLKNNNLYNIDFIKNNVERTLNNAKNS